MGKETATWPNQGKSDRGGDDKNAICIIPIRDCESRSLAECIEEGRGHQNFKLSPLPRPKKVSSPPRSLIASALEALHSAADKEASERERAAYSPGSDGRIVILKWSVDVAR